MENETPTPEVIAPPMDIDEIKDKVEMVKNAVSKFDIKKFSWKDFVTNNSGIPSAGLYIAFFYGCILAFMFCPMVLVLLILHRVSALVTTDLINSLLLFIGTQISAVLTYLGTHKAIDNATTKINKDKADTTTDVNLKTTEIK